MDSHLSVFVYNKHNIKYLTIIAQHNQQPSDLPHEHLLQLNISIKSFSSMTTTQNIYTLYTIS